MATDMKKKWLSSSLDSWRAFKAFFSIAGPGCSTVAVLIMIFRSDEKIGDTK